MYFCRYGREVPMSQRDAIRNSRAVRWYILTLPVCHRGPAKGLQTELDRRKRAGETLFDFFAPTYREVIRKGGKWIETARPLLYNYVFVKASENEIYRMMRDGLGVYSFLPRVRDGKSGYYPYLSDRMMDNLKWVARSYSDVLPVCPLKPEYLLKGDKVRIVDGQFKDAEATVVASPGAGQKDVVVCVENWMCIPLMHVRQDQYEIVSLNTDASRLYSRLNNIRLLICMHEALRRRHTVSGVTDDDRMMAKEILRQYRHLEPDSDIMRCKLYSMLLPAYAILGDREAFEQLLGTVRSILPLIRAEQSRSLLLVTLYGCTNCCLDYEQAHAAVDPWRGEQPLKKSKAQLLHRLDDYDSWLGHRE